MINRLKRLHWIINTQLGFDPIKLFNSIFSLPKLFRDYWAFRKNYSGEIEFLPCLGDWKEQGGAVDNEYFWQDLYVARAIHAANPTRHVDVGSRVDGFVAHVASFREIEILDIRPIHTQVPGVRFRQADITNLPADLVHYCDSLSCLHALEHFGLGRYGDPIDAHGHEKGLRNLAAIIRPGGVLYLGVPVGRERVQFNGGRVFSPENVIALAEKQSLVLGSFAWYMTGSGLTVSDNSSADLAALGRQPYGLGLFTFTKILDEEINENLSN